MFGVAQHENQEEKNDSKHKYDKINNSGQQEHFGDYRRKTPMMVWIM